VCVFVGHNYGCSNFRVCPPYSLYFIIYNKISIRYLYLNIMYTYLPIYIIVYTIYWIFSSDLHRHTIAVNTVDIYILYNNSVIMVCDRKTCRFWVYEEVIHWCNFGAIIHTYVYRYNLSRFVWRLSALPPYKLYTLYNTIYFITMAWWSILYYNIGTRVVRVKGGIYSIPHYDIRQTLVTCI